MVTDYYAIRKKILVAGDLYKRDGVYTYTGGFHMAAIIALLLGVLPNIPGFLVTIKVIDAASIPTIVADLYNYAWFVGFAVSSIAYWLLARGQQTVAPTAPVT